MPGDTLLNKINHYVRTAPCDRPRQSRCGRPQLTDDSEPLSPALWFERIEMIARGELRSVENSLRHAAHMLQLTPKPFRDVVHMSLDEDTFEALLDAGELDTAARHLVAQPTALSVEEEPDGPVRAVISCVILKRAIHGRGESVATAVLDAWTTCLLALRTEFGADLVNLTDQPLQKDQAGQHRRFSWH
jgi:hypothetical protein